MNILSHRKLIIVALCLLIAGAVQAKEFLVYFGTYTNGLSRGIYVSRLDTETGTLSDPILAAETPSPCWISLSPDQKYLYAANSVKSFAGQDGGAVSAFAVDAKSGQLTLLNEKPSGADGPCYVSTDNTGRMLMVAHYGGRSVTSFTVETNGAIGNQETISLHEGHGTNQARQASAHAHFVIPDPKNHFALACDLGLDKVMVYTIDPNTATIKLKDASAPLTVPAGSGSRHLIFSRDGKFVHVINEMACTITTLKWNGVDGTFAPVETISTLPASVPWQANYTAAEIVLHPSGKYVYATVRGSGADLISVFKADSRTGKLTWLQSIGAGGEVPRGLGIDPTGHWLITGNQKSNNAVEYAVSAKNGMLTPTGRELKMGAPVVVQFIRAQ